MLFGGFLEIIVFLFFGLGGSIGAPLGTPPAPEDPLMAAVAPEECLAYTTWSGIVPPAANGNATEQWLAQPEIGAAWQKARASYLDWCQGDAEPEDAAQVESLLEIANHLLTHACAIYLSETTLSESGPFEKVVGGALVDLGDDPAARARQFQESVNSLIARSELKADSVTIAGRPCQTMILPDWNENLFSWGMVDDRHLAVTVGEGEMERLVARLQTPPPPWLSQLRQRLPVPRISSVSWVDGKKVVELILDSARLGGDDQVGGLFETLGFHQLRDIGLVTGLDNEGFISRGHLAVEGAPRGILGLFSNDPITPGNMGRIPKDKMFTLGVAVSPTRVFELTRDLAGLDEYSRNGFNEGVDRFNASTGLNLENDIIRLLDEHGFMYGSINITNPLSGWVFGVGASQEMALSEPFEKLNRMIREGIGEEYDVSNSDVDGNMVYSYEDKTGWGFPSSGTSWTLAEGELLLSLDKSSLRRHLRRASLADDALARDDWFSGVFTPPSEGATGPLACSSVDFAQLLQIGMGVLTPFAGEIIPKDMEWSFSDLPPLDVLTRNMRPHVSAVYRTPDGFETVQRQTFPGGSPLNMFPAAGIAALPASIEIARSAARTQSANNIRQLILAMHNYHDQNKAFPARFNKSADGRPLLSWRVHVLPFLGYSELYDRFHLDEPWDSDHNKALIDQMPAEYTHPRMKLVSGKTVYAVPAGEDCVVGDPGDAATKPKGTSLERIADGTSHTALILELSAENAVTWTKPDDYDWEDTLSPESGLYAGWKTVFLVGLCDGSVLPLKQKKLAGLFEEIVRKNDGNVVDLWSDD